MLLTGICEHDTITYVINGYLNERSFEHMIPKIIHFSWISGDPYPPLAEKCMKSWEKFAPDYEIMHWDKERFDIQSLLFTRQAYENKRWPFIADVQRLYALYMYGGIYLDSDVELVKPLDEFLTNGGFIGFEGEKSLSTGVIGCEKGHPWIKRLLEYYNDLPFINADGSLYNISNAVTTSEISKQEFGFDPTQKNQVFGGNIRVYPQAVFSPKSLYTWKIETTGDTHAIHHFACSWISKKDIWLIKKQQFKNKMAMMITRLFGDRVTAVLFSIKRKLLLK